MQKSPEQRTNEFKALNYEELASRLYSRVIKVEGADVSIVLTNLLPYSLAKNLEGRNSWMYEPMQTMEGLDLWARYHPLRKMCLSLVVAQDAGRVGACVQIVSASRIAPNKETPVSMPKQGDIATTLGLGKNEIGKLRFLDGTETLHLIRTGVVIDRLPKEQDKRVNTKDANQELAKFFEQATLL